MWPPPVGSSVKSGSSAAAAGTVMAFILGEGLPAIPVRLVKKILNGDYIDTANSCTTSSRQRGGEPIKEGPPLASPVVQRGRCPTSCHGCNAVCQCTHEQLCRALSGVLGLPDNYCPGSLTMRGPRLAGIQRYVSPIGSIVRGRSTPPFKQ